MEYNSVIKKELTTVIHTTTWMNLKEIMLA